MDYFKIFKDLAGSGYYPATGEIVAGSRLSYLHEYRHSQQPKSLITAYTYMFVFFLPALLLVNAYKTGDIFSLFMIVVASGLLAYMEVDAWVYAFKNIKKKKE